MRSINHQAFIDRFGAICQADTRIVAAFIGGSHAQGTADVYSDLDLYLITTNEAYADFVVGRQDFIRLLSNPLFLEDFDLPDTIFFIFPDGVEGELRIGMESQFDHIYLGPYRILVDKKGILEGVIFSGQPPTLDVQIETLRRLIYWFWHDLSHFITAMGRGQLWWAYGQLEVLRLTCVNLARLQQDFEDEDVGTEGYFKLEKAILIEQLTPLQESFPPMQPEPMLQAAHTILRFYQELAPALASAYGIAYPADLERILSVRLAELGVTGPD
jgi:hypothetical protein